MIQCNQQQKRETNKTVKEKIFAISYSFYESLNQLFGNWSVDRLIDYLKRYLEKQAPRKDLCSY